MKIKAKRTILHDQAGRIGKDQTGELPDALAKDYIKRGWVEKYDTKVVKQEPEAGADGTKNPGPVEGEVTIDVGAAPSTKAKSK